MREEAKGKRKMLYLLRRRNARERAEMTVELGLRARKKARELCLLVSPYTYVYV